MLIFVCKEYQKCGICGSDYFNSRFGGGGLILGKKEGKERGKGIINFKCKKYYFRNISHRKSTSIDCIFLAPCQATINI